MQRQQGGMAVQKLEGDVDLDLIREREDAIKNIEVFRAYNITPKLINITCSKQ